MGGLVRERHHRLASELYRGFLVVSITICIKNKQKFFTTQDRFNIFEEMLLNALQRFDCSTEVYVFMPDHVHLLIRGESENADILRAIKLFKQKTGFWLHQHHPSVRWQKDFYDHILRKDEEIKTHVLYILNNPVRQRLIENWKEYPFKGSTIHNLDEWEFI